MDLAVWIRISLVLSIIIDADYATFPLHGGCPTASLYYLTNPYCRVTIRAPNIVPMNVRCDSAPPSCGKSFLLRQCCLLLHTGSSLSHLRQGLFLQTFSGSPGA